MTVLQRRIGGICGVDQRKGLGKAVGHPGAP
jgi:hypothetical protein